ELVFLARLVVVGELVVLVRVVVVVVVLVVFGIGVGVGVGARGLVALAAGPALEVFALRTGCAFASRHDLDSSGGDGVTALPLSRAPAPEPPCGVTLRAPPIIAEEPHETTLAGRRQEARRASPVSLCPHATPTRIAALSEGRDAGQARRAHSGETVRA